MRTERRSIRRTACRVAVKVYESSAGWCVRWQSDRMIAPGFWYYPTEQEARRTAGQLQGTRSPSPIASRRPDNG